MSQYIWATFVRKFVAKNFQKFPNLATLPSVKIIQTLFKFKKAIGR